jgi:hypothetical protein
MNDKIIISIDSEIQRFQKFLLLEENKKIIFSAPFGNGKTYFLNNFFDGNGEYQPFFIYPVHYVVSSNDDIFEYIKFDVIFKLLEIIDESEKIDFSNNLLLPFFIQNNINELISLVAEFSGKIGKALKLLPQILKLNKSFEEYKERVQKTDYDILLDYLHTQKNKNGSIYESNLITELLDSLIDDWKNKAENTNKKTVLIIDDLDRLDPEHIFRIFNIFAAHSDYYQQNEIKYGFDKIMLVCDINNVRKIFHSKYGLDVDFAGYIDKFYDRDIFFFDNHLLVEESVDRIFKSIRFDSTYNDILNFRDDLYTCSSALKFLIKLCIKNNLINLRSLLKYSNKPYSIKDYMIPINWKSYNYNTAFAPFIVLDLMSDLMGTDKDLKLKIEILGNKLISEYFNDEILEKIIRTFIALADYSKNRFRIYNMDPSYEYTILDSTIIIRYRLTKELLAFVDFKSENILEYAHDITRNILNEACSNYLKIKSGIY